MSFWTFCDVAEKTQNGYNLIEVGDIHLDFSEKIRALRLEQGLTLEDVGKLVGVGKSTVRKWETGAIANMRRDKIAKLASALHTTPGYLMGWDDAPNTENDPISLPDNIIPLPKTHYIPLVGTIACGEPLLADENLDGAVSVPEYIHADFALRCKGDSMIGARIMDGDIVCIRQQPDIEDGEIAAVLIDGEATLKRVYKIPGRLILRPENPSFPVLEYTGSELEQVRILGKAVYFISPVK